ncbi:MAG: type II secretion system GspH family protein [Lentisphaeraceae bacterium]|nr:type II secretion system GspH family protein [Lentisphaeraceae bacterium]
MKKELFTLIELLFVIAVIGILLTLLLPSLSKSREITKRAVCLSNLSQCHKANLAYGIGNNHSLPPGNAVLDSGQGINSVYRIATNMAFGAAIAYQQKYTDTPDNFYCPSWTQPYM